MSTDPLLAPFALKNLTLRNRVVSTSHEPAYAENGMPTERYRLYHAEKARGGLALTMIGGSANVSLDSPSSFGQLYLGDDTVIPHLQELSEAVHNHGALVMSQLTHMGRRAPWDSDRWFPTVSSSALRERAHRSTPKEAEDFDLRRIVRDFGRAAARCQEGGLDGIEISAHGGHLLDQFLSPRMNRRTDEYGGTPAGRLRLLLEVLEEVRSQVGHHFVVGVRMSASEEVAGGVTREDAVQTGKALESSGLVDFLSLTVGSATTDVELAQQIQPLGSPLGAYLSLVGEFRDKVRLPVMHAGRIADLATARHALREGYVDLVGMVRAHLADPHLVRKLQAGQEDRIRPCVGASYCLNRIYIGQDALCLHNPATGRERLIPHVAPAAPSSKRVVVVGAGPAGLEAARVAAERGHEVTVLEAASDVGGQVRLASRAGPAQGELLSIINWLAAEVRHLGGRIRLNRYAEGQDVLALTPDVVIVATGGLPATPELEDGADLVLSTWDLLTGDASPKQRILVFDEHGSDQALSTAQKLTAAGSQVELVSPDRLVGQEVVGTMYPQYLSSLYASGAVLTPDHHLIAVRRAPDGLVAVLRNAYTRRTVERVVDQVVAECGTEPNAEVYEELRPLSRNQGETDLQALASGTPPDQSSQQDQSKGQGFTLYRIGDAVAGRNIHAAMLDARRLGLTV
ncbi:NADH:flavin oxidoreductase [Ornithinimicrobium cavernae]|uniref:NADH:flavin oxidoreductase n=1 Tax=Ornithinimicrobium cavernae TaxID=2666047 RepID=UPI000D68E1AC|nr:NADH:flavin oxidoreductase [Ornithinimicrobium cavernae]